MINETIESEYVSVERVVKVQDYKEDRKLGMIYAVKFVGAEKYVPVMYTRNTNKEVDIIAILGPDRTAIECRSGRDGSWEHDEIVAEYEVELYSDFFESNQKREDYRNEMRDSLNLALGFNI
jgi:hypothetical protein